MRILVLISGNGSNLQALIDAQQAQQLGQGRIAGVISDQPHAYGLERARRALIPVQVVSALPHECRSDYDARLADVIQKFDADLIVLAGFMRILSEPLVRQYQGCMLNIHPSLLPKYKGLNTHQRALAAGDKEHGCSVHFVTPSLDSGPVILQGRCPVLQNDDTEHLQQRVHRLEHQIYPLAVRWFCEGRLALTAQGAYLDGQQLPASGLCFSDHMEL